MRKIRRAWKQSSKKLRFILYILIIVLLITSIYVFVSAPAFTSQILYRRYEKANLIGPAEILGIHQRDFSVYDRILLAETEEGVVIFAESLETKESPQLIYRQKTGGLTVLAAPDPAPMDPYASEKKMTLFAFDSCPEAVSARMEFTLSAEYGGVPFEKTYTLESQRQIPGVFCFKLHALSRFYLGTEAYALQLLTMVSGYCGSNYFGLEFPVTVSFYDADGNLIRQESAVISSPATQAAS